MNNQNDDDDTVNEETQFQELNLTEKEKQKLADIIFTYMVKDAQHGVASHEVLVKNIRTKILTNFKECGMNWQPFEDENNNKEISASLRGIIDQVVKTCDGFDRLFPVEMETEDKSLMHQEIIEAFSKKKNIKKEELKQTVLRSIDQGDNSENEKDLDSVYEEMVGRMCVESKNHKTYSFKGQIN